MIKRNKPYKCNEYIIEDDFVLIKMSKGEVFVIDKEDLDRVKAHYWHLGSNNYAYSFYTDDLKKVRRINLHRYIMGVIDDSLAIIDHIDANKNNCCKSNLRITTKATNGINRHPRKDNPSGYVGIAKHKKCTRWESQISVDGKRIILGYFDNINEAINARVLAEKKYYGIVSVQYREMGY